MAGPITAVHVTHEITGKIGGIGAVLQGLFTSQVYLKTIERSILVGPLFSIDGHPSDRLGEDGAVLFSTIDKLENTPYAAAFHEIEHRYHIGIIYGRRTFTDSQTGIESSPEVLLVDITKINKAPVNEFKAQMYEKFGIQSNLYEHLWEYEQYVRIAPPIIALLKAIGAATDSTVIFAHEFMGMPTALAAVLEPSCHFKTIFYAHEVATMRRIVEQHTGHDTMFYNVIRHASSKKLYVSDTFGNQNTFFKHPLVAASKYCDRIYAVGDRVVEELRFMAPDFETTSIDTVYNGIPAHLISFNEKLKSKEKLQLYCENLLGFRPDFIFTHVTRLVPSKALWRDIMILEYLDKQFHADGKTAVLLVLSTEVAPRRSSDIMNIEAAYRWPVAHREGWPDLSGGEANYYTTVQEFNAKSRNIKVVFINQFGFTRKYCGQRMPEDMKFMDIRKGSDVEFGLSVYEPFGIAQLEPLTFGGICVVSSVCGCAGFAKEVTGDTEVDNIIIADYTDIDNDRYTNIDELLTIDQSFRRYIEVCVSRKVAAKLASLLTADKSKIESMIKTGYTIAKNMSWDVVVSNHLLVGLQKILQKQYQKS